MTDIRTNAGDVVRTDAHGRKNGFRPLARRGRSRGRADRSRRTLRSSFLSETESTRATKFFALFARASRRAARSASASCAGGVAGWARGRGGGGRSVSQRCAGKKLKRRVSGKSRDLTWSRRSMVERWYVSIWRFMSVAVSRTSVTLALCAAAVADLRAFCDATRSSLRACFCDVRWRGRGCQLGRSTRARVSRRPESRVSARARGENAGAWRLESRERRRAVRIRDGSASVAGASPPRGARISRGGQRANRDAPRGRTPRGSGTRAPGGARPRAGRRRAACCRARAP